MSFQMYVLEEKMASEQIGEQRGLQLGLQRGLQLGRTEGLQLGRTEGLQLGRTEGLQQGRAEEKEAVAIKMIRRGKSHDEIRELTDLPPERIQQLAANLESENPA